jgi:polar amino acid transport system substrate-binding protein
VEGIATHLSRAKAARRRWGTCFATNKAILYELSDRLPGSTVLEGAWGYEKFAAGIPKGREGGLPLLNQFLSEAQKNGRIADAVKRAGVRGTVPPER